MMCTNGAVYLYVNPEYEGAIATENKKKTATTTLKTPRSPALWLTGTVSESGLFHPPTNEYLELHDVLFLH